MIVLCFIELNSSIFVLLVWDLQFYFRIIIWLQFVWEEIIQSKIWVPIVWVALCDEKNWLTIGWAENGIVLEEVPQATILTNNQKKEDTQPSESDLNNKDSEFVTTLLKLTLMIV